MLAGTRHAVMQTLEDRPDYYRLYHDKWQVIKGLPKPQGRKLLYAVLGLFFDGIEPAAGDLPREAQRAYLIMRPDILRYRRNVLNGSKNGRRNERKAVENMPEKGPQKPPETEQETEVQTDDGFHASSGALPADILKVGTYPDTNQDTALGTDMDSTISNKKSVISTRGASYAPRAARANGTPPIIDTHSTVSPTELEHLITQTSGTPEPERA